jgi:DNA-binding transcriptional regulator YiaG
MDDHAHLLIKEEKDEISRIMKRINVSYAYYFNKKYDRVGHVFQDRFKSEVIEDEKYLLAAIRYIHNNPVKAKIKDGLKYKWSSYLSYIQKNQNNRGIIERRVILELFSTNEDQAIKILAEYTLQKNDDVFLEYKEDTNNRYTISSQKEAKEFIVNFLKVHNLTKDTLNARANITMRNELIRQLRQDSNLSIRQIANLLGVNRGIVYRIKP